MHSHMHHSSSETQSFMHYSSLETQSFIHHSLRETQSFMYISIHHKLKVSFIIQREKLKVSIHLNVHSLKKKNSKFPFVQSKKKILMHSYMHSKELKVSMHSYMHIFQTNEHSKLTFWDEQLKVCLHDQKIKDKRLKVDILMKNNSKLCQGKDSKLNPY